MVPFKLPCLPLMLFHPENWPTISAVHTGDGVPSSENSWNLPSSLWFISCFRQNHVTVFFAFVLRATQCIANFGEFFQNSQICQAKCCSNFCSFCVLFYLSCANMGSSTQDSVFSIYLHWFLALTSPGT